MGPIGSNNSDPLFQSIRQSWDHLSSSCSGQKKNTRERGNSPPPFSAILCSAQAFSSFFFPPLCGDREEATTNGFGRAGRRGHLLLGPSVVVVRPPGHREPSISREGGKALWGIIRGERGKHIVRDSHGLEKHLACWRILARKLIDFLFGVVIGKRRRMCAKCVLRLRSSFSVGGRRKAGEPRTVLASAAAMCCSGQRRGWKWAANNRVACTRGQLQGQRLPFSILSHSKSTHSSLKRAGRTASPSGSP